MSAPESAQHRLARSRAQMTLWLDQDHARRDAFAHSGLGQLTALPWVQQIGRHPLASLALGALTQWWMKPREARSSKAGLVALGTGLGLLRRRPLLTVGTVTALGAAVWFQLRKRSAPPLK